LNLRTVQKNFVQVIRAVKPTLGISVPSSDLPLSVPLSASNNFTAARMATSSASVFSAEMRAAFSKAVPIFREIGAACGLQTIFEASIQHPSISPLTH
jgi:hypothetical protein